MNRIVRAGDVLNTLLIVVIVLGGYLFYGGLRLSLDELLIPKCGEDVVLVGAGQFEDGHWDYYVCGPAVDDYIQASP